MSWPIGQPFTAAHREKLTRAKLGKPLPAKQRTAMAEAYACSLLRAADRAWCRRKAVRRG